MTDNDPNPFAAPQPTTTTAPVSDEIIDPRAVRKIEAIIKDAGQFWLAILLCMFCVGVGILFIGPWYLVRLIQWSIYAGKYPSLLAPNSPATSLAQRFQSAKIKLIVGMLGGSIIFMLALLAFVVSSTVPAP